MSNTSSVTGSGTLAVLHFSSLGSSGQTEIEICNGIISDNSANEIAATRTGTSVAVLQKSGSGSTSIRGGGSGGIPPVNLTGFSGSLSIGTGGYALYNSSINSPDGKVTLNIRVSTRLLAGMPCLVYREHP